jgi:hypothetical protein
MVRAKSGRLRPKRLVYTSDVVLGAFPETCQVSYLVHSEKGRKSC